MTASMHAIHLSEFGDPSILQPVLVDIPTPGPEDVLVKISATGICGRDVLYRQGTLGAARGFILGHEIAGTVAAVGKNVETLRVGDRVAATQRRSCHKCGYCTSSREVLCQEGALYGDTLDGGYAEYCVIEEMSLALVPEGVSNAAAAIAACGIGTGYHALRLAGMKGGETVLITGASGGVGMHSIQIAKAMGCRVIAVTTSPEKTDHLLESADEVVVMNEGRFHQSAAEKGLSPDIVLDLTAAYTLESSLRSVKRGGTVAIVGNMGPGSVEVLPGAFIMRETTLVGSKACTRQELVEVLDLIDRGLITPLISREFSLEDASEAHRALEAKEITGRAVLVF